MYITADCYLEFLVLFRRQRLIESGVVFAFVLVLVNQNFIEDEDDDEGGIYRTRHSVLRVA